MSQLDEKVSKSIERLRAFEPPEGYYLAFSGGKDSVVTKAIADLSGVKYTAHYRVTTVDPPELVRFIKEKYPEVSRDVPRYKEDYRNKKLRGKPITMWNLIPEKMMPPTRIARYCCEKLKEDGGDGGVAVTGVRWAESVNRKKNQGAVVIKGDYRREVDEDQQSLFDDDDELDIEVNARHGSLILTNDNEKTAASWSIASGGTKSPSIRLSNGRTRMYGSSSGPKGFRIAPCTMKASTGSDVLAARWQAQSSV